MKKTKQANLKIAIGLVFVLSFTLIIRLIGLNWDQGFYLHPDERFLTMTIGSVNWPNSFAQYLNPQTSPLNPYNQGVGFFVYGHFPLILAKGLAVLFNFNNYTNFFWLGRALSALLDTGIILAVFFLALLVFNRHQSKTRISLLAALCYSLMVLPLQQAHFFISEPFLNAFLVWSVVFLLFSRRKKFWLFFSAICFGLALACKITAVLALPLLLWFIWLFNRQKKLTTILVTYTWFGCSGYLALRLADPYLFKSTSWLNPLPNPRWLQNLKDLNSFGKTVFYPPGVQWQHTNWRLPLKNLLLFGLGPGLAALIPIGLILLWQRRKQLHKPTLILLISIGIWLLAWFVLQSLQLGKTMRYYLPLYPFLTLFIAFGLFYLPKLWRLVLILPALIWFISFAGIYTRPHSRVTASNWLNRFLPQHSRLITEYWDDPLPLNPDLNKQLQSQQLDFYQPDSLGKWQKIAKILNRSDYLVLSSNRLYGSIPKVPDLYPNASLYYQKLLKNQLRYRLVKRFVVLPQLSLGPIKLTFNDQQAEEAFTVYDHPQVLIFKRQKNFNEAYFLRQIGF